MKFKSDIITATENVNINNMIDSLRIGRRVEFARAVVTFTEVPVVGDTIELYTLPEGAEIQVEQCEVLRTEATGSVTLDIGDAVEAARYADSLAIFGDDKKLSFAQSDGFAAQLLAPVQVTSANNKVVATITATAGILAGTTMIFKLAFKI